MQLTRGGLRRGELRALFRNDVDLAGGLIRVERSMSSYGEAGDPRVALAGAVCRSRPRSSISLSSTSSYSATDWTRIRLKRNASVHAYSGSHTFASVLIAAGVNAKAIITYLGHASIQTTFDLYGHLRPGNEDEAVRLVDAYLDRTNTHRRIVQVDCVGLLA